MKKNVVIIILALTTVLSVIYGVIQRAEAQTQRRIAEENLAVSMAAQAELKKLQDANEAALKISQEIFERSQRTGRNKKVRMHSFAQLRVLPPRLPVGRVNAFRN